MSNPDSLRWRRTRRAVLLLVAAGCGPQLSKDETSSAPPAGDTHVTAAVWTDAVSAEEMKEGIYGSNLHGDRVRRNDGAAVGLGQRFDLRYEAATLTSTNNENTNFELVLTKAGPFPSETDIENLQLVVAGVCLRLHRFGQRQPDGTVDFGAAILGELPTHQIALALHLTPKHRQHPGHCLQVHWTPERTSYAVGDEIGLTMTMRNVGDQPFAFFVGGKQRGPRDNQYRFLAYHGHGSGHAVPDTGDPLNMGGIGWVETLKPGETYTATIPLHRWFQFTKPDVYRITGLFELAIHDVSSPSDRWPIWDDLAAGDCLVKIVDRDE